jgi:hypothetical protein
MVNPSQKSHERKKAQWIIVLAQSGARVPEAAGLLTSVSVSHQEGCRYVFWT